MGAKFGKGLTETISNDDASKTYVWTLKNGNWSHFLSADRSWNWFRDECYVESPFFVAPGGTNAKFRIGLKESPGFSSILAYAKLLTPVSEKIHCRWQILIGDAPNSVSFAFRSRVTSRVDGNIRKCDFVAEFDGDPPVDVTLSIHLTIWNECQQKEETARKNSISTIGKIDSNLNTWRSNMNRLLSTSSETKESENEAENDYHFDVTLVVGGTHCFDAHRSVLACHSPVFAAMFRKSNDFKESHEREVAIDDVSNVTMAYMLQYLYTGDLVEKLDGAVDGLVSFIAGIQNDRKIPYRDLLQASEKYLLQGLKEICESNLARALTPDNVCELIVLADMYSASLLKSECLRFVKGREARIGASEAFGKLARQSSTLFKELCSKLW